MCFLLPKYICSKILVPLAGLQELLMLRDSMQIKKQLLKDLDPERAKIVRKSIAKFFDNDDDDADPAVLKTELMQTWSGVKIPKMRVPSITIFPFFLFKLWFRDDDTVIQEPRYYYVVAMRLSQFNNIAIVGNFQPQKLSCGCLIFFSARGIVRKV